MDANKTSHHSGRTARRARCLRNKFEIFLEFGNLDFSQSLNPQSTFPEIPLTQRRPIENRESKNENTNIPKSAFRNPQSP